MSSGNDKIVKFHADGFYIVKPKKFYVSVPFVCPKCSKKMSKINDVVAFKSYFCCGECDDLLGIDEKAKWKEKYITDNSIDY